MKTKIERFKYLFTVYRLQSTNRGKVKCLSTLYSLLPTKQGGVALVTALLITLAVTILITGTLYIVTQSTMMSGAGKRYATAAEAADGSIEIMKAAIHLIAMGESVDSLPVVDPNPGCLVETILFEENIPCSTTLTLPAADLLSSYLATITVTRLYSSQLPGSRLEFPKAGSGPASTAIYYRITSIVAGAGGTRAETSALYRYVL